jgi:hypothetical protein
VALLTTLLGLLTSYLSVKFKRERDERKEDVGKMADLLKKEEETTKATIVHKVVERIPVGITPDQLSSILEKVYTHLPVQTTTGGIAQTAVEKLINDYHEQALSQSRFQFWFSTVAATVGFGLIIYFGFTIRAENLRTVFNILPGAVIDVVSLLFFRQAAETRKRATDLYDRLRADKQISECINLVGSIEDIKIKSATKAQIALHMSGLQPNPLDLTLLCVKEKT